MRLGMGLGLGNLLSGQPLTGFPNDFSFNFDGSNDYLNCGNTSLELSAQISLSFWAKNDSSGLSSNQYITSQYDYNSNQRAFRIFFNSDEKITFSISKTGSGISEVISSSAISNIDSWNHFVLTFNAGAFKLYVNGTDTSITSPSDASVDAIHNATTDILVGSALNGGAYWDGLIDEVAVWDTALSASDVAKIASKPVDFSKASTYATDRTSNLKLWLRAGDKVLPESDTSIARQDFYTDFDSSNTLVNCGDDTSFDMTTSYTLMGWVNLTAITSATQFLFGRDDGTNRNYWIEITNSNGYVSSVNLGTSDTSTVGSACPVGVWTHICSSYDGANVKVYINGKLDVSESVTGTLDNDDVSFTIGARDSADRAFGGGISNVSLYKTALDAQTISQMAKSRFTPMRDNRFSVVDFSSSNDRIEISNNSALSFGTNVHTISAWAKLDVLANYKTIISKRQASGTVTDYNLSVGANGVVYTYNGSAVGQTATGVISAGSWFHYALVYSGSAYQLYINGSAVAWASGTTTSGASNSHDIGIGWDRTGNYWEGSISSVSLYNVAKSAEEIYAQYSKGITHNPSADTGLVGLWRMGSDASKAYPTIADSSSNSNDGTITNGALGDIVQQMVAGYDMGAFESSSEELGGSEITSASNTTFSGVTSNDWTSSGATKSFSNDQMVFTMDGDSPAVVAQLSSGNFASGSGIPQKLLKVTLDIDSTTTGSYRINNAGGSCTANVFEKNPLTTGINTVYGLCDGASSYFRLFEADVSTGDKLVLNSFDVQEVLQSADLSDSYPAIIDVNEPVLGAELWDTDASTFDSGTHSWVVYGNNTIANDSGALKITYVDNTNGAYLWFRDSTDLNSDLVVGKLYKLTFDAKVNTGSVDLVVIENGGSTPSATITETSFTSKTVIFKAGSPQHDYIRLDINSGEILFLDNFSLQQLQGNVGTMTNQDSADLVYSSVLPDQSFLTGVNSAYNFIDFDGTDDLINIGSDASIDNVFVGGATLTAWIKPSSDGENDLGRIFDKSTSTNGSDGWHWLVTDESSGKVELVFGHGRTNQPYWSSPLNVILNEWNHVAVTYDNSSSSNNPSFYINGISVTASLTGSTTGDAVDDSSQNLFIGNNTGGDRSFAGGIAGIALWGKSLSALEISAIYTAGRHFNLLDNYSDNLKAYFACGLLDATSGFKDTSSTIYDRSGNSNHGTVSGATLKSPPNAEPNGYAKSDTNRSTTTP